MPQRNANERAFKASFFPLNFCGTVELLWYAVTIMEPEKCQKDREVWSKDPDITLERLWNNYNVCVAQNSTTLEQYYIVAILRPTKFNVKKLKYGLATLCMVCRKKLSSVLLNIV